MFHRLKNLICSSPLIPFLIIHFCVWVIVPLFRPTVPMDSAEAIVWGSEGTFGTNKHPFISGWLAYAFFKIFQSPDISTYILSQICILIGFIYIYKIARLFLHNNQALLAALFLEGTIYYSISSIEFNVNVLSLTTVPMGIFYFCTAVLNQKSKGLWLITGLLAGVLILTKYTNAVFLAAMALFMITTPTGRRQFKNPWVYAGGILAVCVLIPHILFLYHHDFYVFGYLTGRAQETNPTGWGHLLYPISFIGSQLAACALTLILFGLTMFKQPISHQPTDRTKTILLLTIGAAPLCLLLLFSFITGTPFKSMWGFATLYLVPVLLFYFIPRTLSDAAFKKGIILTYIVMGLLALSGIGYAVGHISSRAHFPARPFCTEMHRLWTQKYHTPLTYVGGDIWFSSLAMVYHDQPVRVLIDMDTHIAPWIQTTDITKAGAIAFAPDIKTYRSYQTHWSDLSEPAVYTYHLTNIFGRQKEKKLYFGFLPPIKKQ